MTLQEQVSKQVARYIDQASVREGDRWVQLRQVSPSEGDSSGCVRFVVVKNGEPTKTEVVIVVTAYGEE